MLENALYNTHRHNVFYVCFFMTITFKIQCLALGIFSVSILMLIIAPIVPRVIWFLFLFADRVFDKWNAGRLLQWRNNHRLPFNSWQVPHKASPWVSRLLTSLLNSDSDIAAMLLFRIIYLDYWTNVVCC